MRKYHYDRIFKDLEIFGDVTVLVNFSNEVEITVYTPENRFLLTGTDFLDFFKDRFSLCEFNLVDYEYKDGKLMCVFKEDNRRFAVVTNLKTKKMKLVAEWNF